MQFTADLYKEAAREHLPVAAELYDSGRYVLANYVSGLAVECILRAYRVLREPAFDERHDLHELYRSSKFERILPETRIAEFAGHVGTVWVQWKNANRYRSKKALR